MCASSWCVGGGGLQLDGLVIDSEARFMLTTSVVHKGLQRKLLNPLARGGYALKKLLPIAIDLLDRTASSWTPPDISPASPAYLQVRTTRHTQHTHTHTRHIKREG
jgi:hypothetical protein